MASHFWADCSPAGDSGSCGSSCSSRSSGGGSSSRSLGPAFSSSTFSSDCSISSSLLHIPADHNSLLPLDHHPHPHHPHSRHSYAHPAAPLPSPPAHPSPLPFSTLPFGKAGTRSFRMLLLRHEERDACASRRDGSRGSDGEARDGFQAQPGEGCHVSKQQQREGGGRIVSPWHDIPLYDADCFLHFVCTRPAGTALRHEFATNEDYSPLRVARGSSPATSFSATPWNVGSLPQTRQDPDESFEGLPELLGSGAPLEAIDLSARRVELGSVYSIKPVAAFAVRSDGGDFAWRVVGVAGDDPAARHVNNPDDTERHFPGALRRVRAWLESEGAADSGVLHEGALGSDAVHMAVARANAAWQLLVDQEVPAPPWTPPPREICASVLAAIWRNKYDLEDGPDSQPKASQPAAAAAAAAGAVSPGGLRLQQEEEAAQSASAAAATTTSLVSPGRGVAVSALQSSNVDAHRQSATARRRFASLFRSKSGRFTNARLSSLGSENEKERERERCPVPKGGGQSVPAAGPSPPHHGNSSTSASLAASAGCGGSGGSSSSSSSIVSGTGRGGGGGSQRLRSIAGDTYDPSYSPPSIPYDRCLPSLPYSSVDPPAASALDEPPASFGGRACGLSMPDGQPLLHLESGSSVAGSSSWNSSGGSSGSSVSVVGGQLPPQPWGTGSHHHVCASLDLLEGGERGPVVEVCDIQHTRHCSVESMMDSAALAAALASAAAAAAASATQSPSPPSALSASAAPLTHSYSLPGQMGQMGHIYPKQLQQQHQYHHHHHHQQKQMQPAGTSSFRTSPPMPLGTSHGLRGGGLPRGGVRRPAGLAPLPIPRPPSPLGSAMTSPGGILKKSSTLERAGSVMVYDDEEEEDVDAEEEEDEGRDRGARPAFRRSSSESGCASPDRGADFGPLSATSASKSTAKDKQPALSRSTSVRLGSGRRVHFNEEVDLVLLEEVSPGAVEYDSEEDGAGQEVELVKPGRRRGHVEVAALRLNISLDEEGQGKAVASPRNLLFQCA